MGVSLAFSLGRTAGFQLNVPAWQPTMNVGAWKLPCGELKATVSEWEIDGECV